jgi:phosphoribosylanthranilate isomerase
MVKVKICGITNLEDALGSFFAGADALGFVFYKKSPRNIDLQLAKNISRLLPKKILRVGVFVDEDIPTVERIARACSLDMLQFHGQESPAYCQKFKGYKIIKAFRVAKKEDLNKVSQYNTTAYLFDSFSNSLAGGTGNKFNWKILAQSARIEPIKVGRAKIKKPDIFISGGLTAGNVCKAIELLKPDWVDVSSSLELRPGKKDYQKIKKFMQALN